MNFRARARNKVGQSLNEAVVGALILIPIALTGLDLTIIVVCNSANDGLVKNAARAAANQGTKAKAIKAAKDCIANFPRSPIILDVKLAGDIDYIDQKQVAVQTVMTMKLPVGLPGMDILEFNARAVEPLVALPSKI